jgi:hypothetical protein
MGGRRALRPRRRAWSLHSGASHVRQKLHPLSQKLVGATPRVLEDAVGFALRFALDQLCLALRVPKQPGCLGLGCTDDRLDALRRIPRKTSKVESVHATTVPPVETRQYRMFV